MSGRYAAASDLFLTACELPVAERASYLEVACRGDLALRAEVEELLAFDVDPAAIEPDAPPHAPLEPGDLFAGRYRVVSRIGRGAMGVVYRALDERLHQTIALKVLRTSSPVRRAQLAREVRLARQVTDPAVCRVHDIQESGQDCFLTMELVEGDNLATLLQRVGRLSPDRVLAVARDVLGGLAAAHMSGVLHRDLKPANLLMDSSGRVRITDFGIATAGDPSEAFDLPAGTPAYMAPEQRAWRPLSAQTDLYSLGVVLYELLTGARPATPPEPPTRRIPDVDPQLERSILAALDPDPARRPSSARVMLEMLRAPEPAAAPERGADALPVTPEQRPVTLMFLARNESTEFAPDLAPEELQEVMARLRAVKRRVLERHGGRVAQRLGPWQLVLFGFPVARDDAPDRAVTAALEIRVGIEQLNRELAPRLAAPISMRAGLHTGIALVEVPEGETDTFAYGAPIKTVLALARRARPWQVLASAELQRCARDASHWRSSGELNAPGIPDPIGVFEVESAPAERARSAPSGPFLGREPELALLRERWRRAIAGEGQLVLVRGEAGVGKSRLLQELRAELGGAQWLEARCTPYTANTPLYPHSEILVQGAGLSLDLAPDERNRRLRESLAGLHFARPDLIPQLERMLAIRSAGTARSIHPKAAREATFAAIFAVTKCVGELFPFVIALEDLHWADPSTLEMLQLANAVRSETRLLLICTMRPELELNWPARDNMLRIELGPLAAQDTRRIAEHVAEGCLAPDSLDAIAARAQGNPLFAGELARDARELGSTAETVPASLRDSLMARLDRLGEQKRIAQVAAVIGRVFSRAFLRELAELPDEKIDEGLHRLEQAQLIAAHGLPPGRLYEFRHALLCDAAYESIPPLRRAALHARAARAFALVHPDLRERKPEYVAHHFERARLPDCAAEAWERAADVALETSAAVEARHHLERALAAAATLAPARERDELELRLRLKLGRCLLATRRHTAPEVQQTFARAHELCRALRPSAATFGGLSEIWVHRAALCDGSALAIAGDLMDVAVASGDRQLVALAEGARAQLFQFAGRHKEVFDAAERALEHLAEARRATGSNLLAIDALSLVHVSMAGSAWIQGLPDRARSEARLALEAARALGDPFNECVTDSLLAYVYFWCGEDDRALELAEANLARAQRFGFGIFEASALGIRSELHLRAGRLRAALADAEADLELRRALGTTLGIGLAHLQHAQVLARIGDVEGAIAAAREAVQLSSLPEDCALLPEAHRVLGLLLLRRDRADEAGERELARALGIARDRDALSLELRAAMALARAPRADFAPLRDAYARFREGFDTADLVEARELLASAR